MTWRRESPTYSVPKWTSMQGTGPPSHSLTSFLLQGNVWSQKWSTDRKLQRSAGLSAKCISPSQLCQYRNIACALTDSCHRCTCEILVLEVVIDNYCLHEAQHVTLYLLALFHLLQVYPELEQLVTKSAELYAEQQVLIKGTTRTHDSRV